MIATSLLDAISRETRASLNGGNAGHADMARIVAGYIDSCLDDWKRILEFEQELGNMEFADADAEREMNRSLFEVYQRWATDAQSVLAHTGELAAGGHGVERADALADAFAMAQARLKLTPEMVERALDQVREGKGIPMGELRDELRSRIRA